MRFLRIVALALIVLVPLTIYTWFKIHYERGELRKHGRLTKGVIIDHYAKRSIRSKIGDRAVVRYVVNQIEYKEEFRDNNFRYSTGDSVKVKYSTKDPKIFRVVSKFWSPMHGGY